MAIIVIPRSEALPKDLEKTLSVKSLNNVQGIVLFDRSDSLHPWVNELITMGHARCDRGVVGEELAKVSPIDAKIIKARDRHQHVFAIVDDEHAQAIVKKVKSELKELKCSLYEKQ